MAASAQRTAARPSSTVEPRLLSRPVLAPVWLCVVAAQATLMMPLLVGSMANRLDLAATQTGLLASAAMLGASLAAALQILVIRRVRWRSMALFLLAMQALGYASLATRPGYALALLAMAGLGAGFGGLLGLGQAAMAETAHQTRALGLTLALMGVVGSGLAGVAGLLGSDFARLALLIAVCVFAAPAAFQLQEPVPRQSTLPGAAQGRRIGGVRFLLAVLAYGLMNLANGGFWPLVERMAVAAHRPAGLVNEAVSLALLASTGGGLAALILGPRVGLFAPIMVTGFLTAACVIGIAASLAPSIFVSALVLFGFLWNFGPAYQLPAITAVDPEGRGMPAAVLAMKLCMAVGPVSYGLIAERAGYLAAGITAAGAALAASLLLASLVVGVPAARPSSPTAADTPP